MDIKPVGVRLNVRASQCQPCWTWWAEWLQFGLRATRTPLGGLLPQAVVVHAGYHGSARHGTRAFRPQGALAQLPPRHRRPPAKRPVVRTRWHWHWEAHPGTHHRALSRLLSTSTTWRTPPLRMSSPLGTTSVWGARGFQGFILLRIEENLFASAASSNLSCFVGGCHTCE